MMSEQHNKRRGDTENHEAQRQGPSHKGTTSRTEAPSPKGQPSERPPAYEDWSLEQLYERASELDLEGRSDMDKPELIAALRGKRYGERN